MSRLPLTFRIFLKGQLVREETLALGVIKLGKVPSAHLRIDDESISRMHAILEVDAKGGVSLIDLGSTRGTFVNGAKINKAQVKSGDVITLGDARIEVAFGAMQASTIEVVDLTKAEPAKAEPAKVIAMPTPPALPKPAPVRAPSPSPMTFAPAVAAKPVTAVATPFAMSTPAPAAGFAAVMAEQTDDPTAPAVEVAAMLGDSVIGVKHCMNPRSGKITPATWAFIGGGAACLLASAIAFTTAYATASRNDEGLQYWTHVQKRPAHAFRPEQTGPLTDIFAFGGLAFGLAGLTAGLARARRERRSPFYRIGTANNVEMPVETAPSASFPLVAPSGDQFVLNVAPGIEGEMIVDGTTTQLADLAAQGRARQSAAVPGAFEVPIPARARIRARAGQTTFMVTAVAKPKEYGAPLISVSGTMMAFLAASFALHMGLYGAAQLATDSSTGVVLDTNPPEQTGISIKDSGKEDPVPEVKDTNDDSNQGGSKDGGQTAMAEGKSGNPTSQKTNGMLQIENHNSPPALSRAEAIRAAQEAGVLGSTSLQTSIGLLAGDPGAITSGTDMMTTWGALDGTIAGDSFGTGAGRFGTDIGGGCITNCGGIGVGQYHTIGRGRGAGDGLSIGGGHGPDMRRTPAVPVVIGHPTTGGGGLDREIIRRYVRRQQTRISYCYEKELLAHPSLEGDVTVQFLVMPNGTVSTSNGAAGAGMSGDVAACVADAVHDIAFPAPTDGGSVQVKYPFHFHNTSAGK